MNGLVLTGGSSSRMGRPKCLLEYQGAPQYRRAAELLSPVCENVWLSCRDEQKNWFSGFDWVLDQPAYGEIGPMNGLLSAFDLHPDTPWFVLGCDYPLLTHSEIEQLISERNPQQIATVFASADNSGPEPLIGIYEPSAAALLQDAWQSGQDSLRRILDAHRAMKIVARHPEHLLSVDTPEAYQHIQKGM